VQFGCFYSRIHLIVARQRSKRLYKLWNRIASGSYFPAAVKEVEILKKDGKTRKLGIPTISDREAQMVVKDYFAILTVLSNFGS
jgi:retron-type reverse transcriptase